MELKAERLFWFSVLLSLLVKIQLALAIPLTSDEAYFTLWGTHLDFGYYDHPPMVGWFLYLISFIGYHQLLIRLPAILTTIAIGIGIYRLLRHIDRPRAALAAAVFLLSPFNLLNVLITTDTPLILFAFISAVLLYRAERSGHLWQYLASGCALGCAFLSKYFAALLGFAYAMYFFAAPKSARRASGYCLLFAAALPFVLLNIYWNYTHCWANIMFNVFNRNKADTFSVGTVLSYLAVQAYLATPVIIYLLVRSWKSIRSGGAAAFGTLRSARMDLFLYAFAVPVALLLFVSLWKTVGLHWMLAFYPFFFLLLAFVFSEDDLFAAVRLMIVFSLIHLFLIAAVLSLPPRLFEKNKNYAAIIMGMHPRDLLMHLEPYAADYAWATPSYADSSVLTYHSKRYFMVFGRGSHHGRQDDIITDYRGYDGKNILVVRSSTPEAGEYVPYFTDVTFREIVVRGARYWVVLGRGFNYGRYRDDVLRAIRDNYYAIPAFLPRGRCYFFEKYFR